MASPAPEEKRKLIVNEIEVWRRNKLLPEQYCDFLQNLYLEDLERRPKNSVEAAVRVIGQASVFHWILAFGIFVIICMTVLHFNAFPLSLQIIIAGLVTAGFVALGGHWREARPTSALMALGGGVAFLFVTGNVILILHGWTEGAGPIVLLSVLSVLSIASGLIIRFALIHWFGWLAFVALYAKLLFAHLPDAAWAEIQLFWIPVSLLFLWLSWYTHVRVASVGVVFFANALLTWFMPELHAALIGIDPQLVQAGLVGKTVLAGAGLYLLRKQWMEWVVR